jgi:hypothetical protein
MERQHRSCARKLVEEALACAKDLGFEPHADYRIARFIFGDIEANACPARFTFDQNGKRQSIRPMLSSRPSPKQSCRVRRV